MRLRCPSIFDTDSIGTPFIRVTVVAKVWRARWILSSKADDFRMD